MNLHLLSDFLNIVESALQNPTDKLATKIAIDGLAAWRRVGNLPEIKQLEADIVAYTATLPAPSQPVAAPVDPMPSQPEAGARGGSMYQGEGATR